MKQVNIGQTVLPWQDKVPVYPKDNFQEYSEGGFSRNELVYACIMELARAVPEAPLRVYDSEDEEIPDHPIRQLIKKPNAFTTEFMLWEMTIMYLMISGNAYWEKVRSRSGQVVELIQLRPDRMRVIPSSEDYIEGYEYEVGGRTFRLPQEDVIHFKMPSPNDDFLGQPPLRSALRAIATDNEATDFVKVMLQNSAVPSVVITTQNAVDKDTADRLTRKWMNRFGSRERGKPAFLQEGMKVEQLGMTLKDLEFPALRAISETRICAVFGVPPIIVGANTGLNRSTFSNYEEARRSFWQETISPLLRKLSDTINADLIPEFTGLEVEARFDSSDVSALQALQNERFDRANTGIINGWMTVNEARTSVGLDPVDGGDVFLRGLNKIGVPIDGSQPFAPPQEEPEQPEDEAGMVPDEQRSSVVPLKKKEVKPLRPAEGKQLELLERAFGKINFALQQERDIAGVMLREFREQARDTRDLFNRSTKQLDEEEAEAIMQALALAQRGWETRLSKKIQPNMEQLIAEALRRTVDEIGIAFDIDDEEAKQFIRQYSFTFAQRVSETSANQVREVILDAKTKGLALNEVRSNLNNTFKSWSTVRSKMVARTETIRATNYGARFGYQQGGVETMEWLASSDACGYCQSLDGTRISTRGEFVPLGGEVEGAQGTPEEGNRLQNNYESVGAPPAHPNCRCTVIPITSIS